MDKGLDQAGASLLGPGGGSEDARLDSAAWAERVESPYGLLEELVWRDEWRLLLVCILLNQTHRRKVPPPVPPSQLHCPAHPEDRLWSLLMLSFASRWPLLLLDRGIRSSCLRWRDLAFEGSRLPCLSLSRAPALEAGSRAGSRTEASVCMARCSDR